MIAQLEGKVLRRTPNAVVLGVQGVGYLVTCCETTLAGLAEGSEASLRIHTVVRDDAIELFGFATELEEQLFLELIRVPGVGPRLAMGILSGGSPAEIAQAIVGGDMARLRKLPGVGKKIAERLVVDLRERLTPHVEGVPARKAPAPKAPAGDELLQALAALGYKPAEAEHLAEVARARSAAEASIEELVREALRAR